MEKGIVVFFGMILACCGLLSAQQAVPQVDNGLKAPESKEVLRVKGRCLYDSGGKRILLRGVEEFSGDSIDEIAKTGTNAYRVVYKTTARELEYILQKAVCRYNMIVSVASMQGVSWWGRPDIREVLKKYESHITLHAYGEAPYDGALPGSDRRWLQESIKTISEIRGYGYRCPLEILADSWGQNIHVLLKYGRQVIEADPERNILLGCQMYSNTRPDGPNRMTIETALKRIVTSGLPFLVGSCAFTDADGNQLYGTPVDGWKRVWRGTYDNRIGCFYWCWSGSPDWLPSRDALSLDGTYGNWSQYGKEICGNGRYSIARTSVKSSRKIENWPPFSSMKIQDLVVDESRRQMTDCLNLKYYFADHEDGSDLTYTISGISHPHMISARIDDQANLDLSIARGSFGTCRISITAVDVGGKHAVSSFTVRIRDSRQKNIALLKHVRASTEKDGLYGKFINDGNTKTRWGSEWKDGQWLIVDLGAPHVIDAFTLHWEAAFGSVYAIQVSTDMREWKTVHREQRGRGGIDEYLIRPVKARYVKILAEKAATPWGFSLWEFAVYVVTQ